MERIERIENIREEEVHLATVDLATKKEQKLILVQWMMIKESNMTKRMKGVLMTIRQGRSALSIGVITQAHFVRRKKTKKIKVYTRKSRNPHEKRSENRPPGQWKRSKSPESRRTRRPSCERDRGQHLFKRK